MKKIFLALMVLACTSVHSQSFLDSLTQPGFSMRDTIGEKLAEIAVQNHPMIKAAEKNADANLYEMQKMKGGWLNNIVASFNMNEANIKSMGSDDNTNIFFPRYNVSLNLPLGNFITRGKDVKKARSLYESAQALREVEIWELKERVKVQYQTYLANVYLLALQERVLQDQATLIAQAEQKFQRNEIGLDVFTIASKRYTDELNRKVTLLRDVNNARIGLEALLGMSLEAAMAQIQ